MKISRFHLIKGNIKELILRKNSERKDVALSQCFTELWWTNKLLCNISKLLYHLMQKMEFYQTCWWGCAAVAAVSNTLYFFHLINAGTCWAFNQNLSKEVNRDLHNGMSKRWIRPGFSFWKHLLRQTIWSFSFDWNIQGSLFSAEPGDTICTSILRVTNEGNSLTHYDTVYLQWNMLAVLQQLEFKQLEYWYVWIASKLCNQYVGHWFSAMSGQNVCKL